MPSITIENYVKQIYLIQQEAELPYAPMGKLSAALGITPGTATTMVKALADAGLAVYQPRVGVSLSMGGERLALHVLRRHRLVELLLVKVLGFNWSEVHEEAEQLEHAISEKVLERIDAYLNHPTHDPHGDPIPDATGLMADSPDKSLRDADAGSHWTVARITDQHPDFLQFIEQCHLVPGRKVAVKARDEQAGAITVTGETGKPVALSFGAAKKIVVRAQPRSRKRRGAR